MTNLTIKDYESFLKELKKESKTGQFLQKKFGKKFMYLQQECFNRRYITANPENKLSIAVAGDEFLNSLQKERVLKKQIELQKEQTKISELQARSAQEQVKISQGQKVIDVFQAVFAIALVIATVVIGYNQIKIQTTQAEIQRVQLQIQSQSEPPFSPNLEFRLDTKNPTFFVEQLANEVGLNHISFCLRNRGQTKAIGVQVFPSNNWTWNHNSADFPDMESGDFTCRNLFISADDCFSKANLEDCDRSIIPVRAQNLSLEISCKSCIPSTFIETFEVCIRNASINEC